MRHISCTGIWLALCSLLAAAEIPYDADIEVDVLFPRNETYNNLTTFPVVLAIQDVKSAYRFEWEIGWKLYNATPNASAYDYQSGYGSHSGPLINDFQWYFDDVAVVPMLGYNFTKLKPGPYRLEWEYYTTPCTKQPPNTIVYNIRRVIASGTHFFSVVDDRSGLDFDIPLDECPLFGDLWSVQKSTSTYCPFLRDSKSGENDPCEAKLKSKGQVECIRDYLFGGTAEVPNNETESCRSAFKRADLAWLEPLSADREVGDDDGDEDEDDNDTDDVSGEQDQNSGDGTSSSSSAQDQNGNEDFAPSLRPSLLGAVVGGFVCSGLLLLTA
ncbi:hypothetical protein BJX76DRAFT_24534 [Aspergillus varians]